MGSTNTGKTSSQTYFLAQTFILTIQFLLSGTPNSPTNSPSLRWYGRQHWTGVTKTSVEVMVRLCTNRRERRRAWAVQCATLIASQTASSACHVVFCLRHTPILVSSMASCSQPGQHRQTSLTQSSLLLPDSSFRIPGLHLWMRLYLAPFARAEMCVPLRHPLWFLSLFWSLSNMLREAHLAERSWLQLTSASSEETKRIWKWPLGASHLTGRNDKPSLSQDLQRPCNQRNQQRTALPNPAHQSETLEF